MASHARDDIDERISSLSPERRALFERLREARRKDQPLVRTERERAPLSSAQQRLWFLTRLLPDRRDYVLAGLVELDGELDRAALSSALAAVLARQTQLRARFHVDEHGRPYSTIAPPSPVVLEPRREPGHARARALLERPFELGGEPLLRLELCELGPRRHELVIVAHHLICDGGSLAIFAAELSAHYRSVREHGQPATLAELAVEYGDFAAWEQHRRASAELREQLDWWRTRLEHGPPEPVLADAGARGGELVGARTRVMIDATLLAAIDGCATQLATTRFTVLSAAFALALHARRGGAAGELWFGTPVAGRDRPELERVVGLFVNMVIVRARVDPDATLAAFVTALGSEIGEALARAELPFERIVEQLRPARGSGETPLLQAAISLQEAAPTFSLGAELEARLTPVFADRVTLELLLVLRPVADGLEAWFEYARDRVDAVAIAGLSEAFVASLRACTGELERPLASLLRGPERPRDAVDVSAPACTNLSPTQLAMWMGQRLHPDAPIYNQQLICQIDGPVDGDRLALAFARVVETNDALRSVIEVEDGVPRQRWPAFVAGPPLERVRLEPGPDVDARARALLAGRGARSFVLDRGLVDAVLIESADQRCYWCLTLHHLITDGRSFELIFERTAREYERLAADSSAALEPAPSFATLRASGRARAGSRLDRAREYWRELPPAPIPALFGRRRDPSHTAIARVRLALDCDEAAGLRALCERPPLRSLTPAMAATKLFATLVAALIHRLSGERELCVGVPLHNRSSSTAKQTVGALMVMCPLRISVPPRPTYVALAAAVDDAFNTALKHLAGLDGLRADRRSYDVVLNYLELGFEPFAGLPTRVEMTTPGHALDTLTVNVYARADALELVLDANTQVFGGRQRAILRTELGRAIADCLRDLAGPIHAARERPAVDGREHAAEPAGPHEPTDSLWAEIEAVARWRPDAVAVVAGARQLSWAGLSARARVISGALADRGLGPGDLVAVVLPRGLDQIVAVLGVVASGAAFLPIDPGPDCARARRDLDRAQALGVRTAIVADSFADSSTPAGVEQLTLAQLGRTGEAARARPRRCRRAPVYAMYTSGTSGAPNAVVVEHAGLRNHARWAVEAFGLDAEDRILQFASPGFDTAAEELFACMLAGATLVVREREGLASPREFWRRCEAAGVTVLDLPTAYWHVLVREGELSPAQLGRVRLIVIGGERAQRDAVVAWQRQIGDAAALLNTYGPTEATIVATAHALGPRSLIGERELPIGRPLPGVRLELLSDDGFPAASVEGVPAELYIGGVGVATGYAGQPRLTAARFVPDPGGPPGARLYRSGDRVCVDDDGELLYLGRDDRQLKVRGVRIEPAALEHLALEHPAVAAAAVVATGAATPGAIQLWVFMVARGQPPSSADELVAGLAPPGVPLRGEWIDALPLTPRGKLDLAALVERAEAIVSRAAAALGRGRAGEDDSIAARLRRIWSELLERELDDIGDAADFFELGGHSLLGAMLIARIERQFGVELPLRSLFEQPRLAALARVVELAREAAGSATVGLRESTAALRREPTEFAPLSPAQERLWFLDQLEPGNPTYNIPAAVELRGELEHGRLARALTALVERHEILRTRFVAGDAGPVQQIAASAAIELPLVELDGGAPAAVERAIGERVHAYAGHRFALDRGPLVIAELLRCAPDRHVLLLNLHHIVADGWSVGILVRELEALYAGSGSALAELLPPLPIQYSDYARWQRERLASARAQADRRWWRSTLAGAPERLELPLDRPRPAVERHVGARLPVRFEPAVGHAIERLARAHEATPFMLVLACFSALLARLGGQHELCVGTPVAGRDHPATEGLIGFFVNTLVLRISVVGEPSFADLLGRVRATCLDALSHRTTPFEAIVEDLRPSRSLAHQPLFQVMFTFLNEPTRRSLGERRLIDWRALEFDRGAANRDLTLRLEPGLDGAIVGHLEYNSDLFDEATAASWIAELQALVAAVLEDPGISVAALARARAREQRKARVESRRAARQRSFSAVARRERGSAGAGDLFEARPLVEGRAAPLVLEPRVKDLDVYAWLERERERLVELARRHGGVLMRGLALDSSAEFARACRVVTPSLMSYDEPSTPRTKLADGIYTSTEYPPDALIEAHNEMAYASHWPRWLWFFCRRPATQGGASPLVDGARVRERIDPELRERFERLGVCYVRNYRKHLDLPWQRVFGTDDPRQVEATCRAAGVEFEWSKDGGLRTRTRSPAIAREPAHGSLVWFNSAHMFHVSALDPEVCASLRALFGEDELPRNAYFGDGSTIDDAAIAHIRAIYREEGLRFPWQRGDLLLLDNMRFAHGREPFSGPRQLLVAMAEPTDDRGLG